MTHEEDLKRLDVPNCSETCPCRCKTEPIVDRDPGDETQYDGGQVIPNIILEDGGKHWGAWPVTFPPVTGRRHPSSQAFHDRMDSLKDLHDRKQADYGSDDDPFANIREGARELGLPAWVGAVIRMNDKIRRLNKAAKQFIETGEITLANEGVLDSFDDLAVYSGIGAVVFEEESS